MDSKFVGVGDTVIVIIESCWIDGDVIVIVLAISGKIVGDLAPDV